jgi:hypothetical protein
MMSTALYVALKEKMEALRLVREREEDSAEQCTFLLCGLEEHEERTEWMQRLAANLVSDPEDTTLREIETSFVGRRELEDPEQLGQEPAEESFKSRRGTAIHAESEEEEGGILLARGD